MFKLVVEGSNVLGSTPNLRIVADQPQQDSIAMARGIINYAAEPLPWLLVAFIHLAFLDGKHDDSLLRRRWLAIRTCLLAAGLLSTVGAGLTAANGGAGGTAIIMLSRLVLLLAVGLAAFSCFLALDAVAHRLLGQGFSNVDTEALGLLCLMLAYPVMGPCGGVERAVCRRRRSSSASACSRQASTPPEVPPCASSAGTGCRSAACCCSPWASW